MPAEQLPKRQRPDEAVDTPVSPRSQDLSLSMSIPENIPPGWVSAIEGAFTNKLEPVITRLQSVEEQQTQVGEQIRQLGSRVSALEHADAVSISTTASSRNLSTKETTSNHVELRGWCKYTERTSKGLTRQEAVALVNMVRDALDPSIKDQVGEPVLSGSRSTSVLLPVPQSLLREIVGVAKEVVANQTVQEKHPGTFARAELTKDRKMSNATFGRVLRFAEAHKADRVVDAFWAPDFAVYHHKDNQPPKLIAKIDVDNGNMITWSEHAASFFGLNTKHDVEYAFRKHRSS
eukprot:TRINITY_DN14627_c0_g1_i1.p1 TRINITY_DN14627_c0_g1~~TRINITY_DN14627_c0_g1_i1.p1  ORF type:complete len:291 (-),score=30.84 TRINITY_DN14627_c0_g1_i1:136-1008(-)